MKNWYVRTFLSMLLMQSKNNSDIELLRALHSCNSKNIRNSLIFLQKMAPYSCFWRVPNSKILLQASLRRISDLLTLISVKNCIIKKQLPELSSLWQLRSAFTYDTVLLL